MKISETWLREWVDPPINGTALAAQLTQAGLEIEAIEPAAPMFSGVVVGEIVAIAPHPQANKLRVCQVSTGTAALHTIVCGAANARVGLRAPLAQDGAVLPGAKRIQRVAMRGVESAGMLCAAVELGLADDTTSGLWELPADAPLGVDLRTWLALDDRVLTLKITPNRGDCLSVRGLAREVAALNNLPLREPACAPVAVMGAASTHLRVQLLAPQACPRYVGRLLRKVNAQAASPLWLVERLRRAGLRSHGVLVDVTNYLLLEQGQPLHAFDAAAISGDIQVRYADPAETLTLLNGQTVTLAADMLVIADAQQPLALAGIMGGANSAVSTSTRDVFLESAHFSPSAIRGRARRLGLHTEASHRFERGVDPTQVRAVLERATALILALAGGEAGEIIEVCAAESLTVAPPCLLRPARVASLLGFVLSPTQMADYLTRLGCTLVPVAEGLQVQAPSYRFDLQQEADFIEELARLHGYDRIPSVALRPRLTLRAPNLAQTQLAQARSLLNVRGYQEAISYSFVDARLQAALDPEVTPLPLANPLSAELAVMRTTLWCGLLAALQFNLNRQQTQVRLFESGLCFRPTPEGLTQVLRLGGVSFGSPCPEQWGSPTQAGDFYQLKGDVEAVLAQYGVTADYTPASHPALHPGQSAQITCGGRVVGLLGLLHPRLEKQLDLPGNVGLFELALDKLAAPVLNRFQPLSKFPAVRRDIAVIVANTITAQQVTALARKTAGSLLRELRLFDVYQGAGLPAGHSSLALGLIFQAHDTTLTDDAVETAVQAVIHALTLHLNANLRS
jgi:phenylalanyl-tRNA synthetase beta chain